MMKIITINICDDQLKLIDFLVGRNVAMSRSDLIRTAVKIYLENEMFKNDFFSEILKYLDRKEENPDPHKSILNPNRHKLTTEEKQIIISNYDMKISPSEIARKHGFPLSSVRRICSLRSWEIYVEREKEAKKKKLEAQIDVDKYIQKARLTLPNGDQLA